jgi:glutathione synthase/RimK-type ligase-like ATP-grasp enzyme
MDQMEEEASWEHIQLGFKNQPVKTFRYSGEKKPVPILLLASPVGGNAPIQRFLDNRIFLMSQVVTDFYTSSLSLPPHQLVINAIGDADRCEASLDAAQRVLEQPRAAVLNPPARIRTTGRAEAARLLGVLEGVVTPRTATLSREILAGPEGSSVLAEHGFSFPVLLRTPGFHGGKHFLRVEHGAGLSEALSRLPGQALTVIQYLDARDPEGKIRKYRVMMIGGKFYPAHLAISREWKVHYFSAEMAGSAEHRAEDRAFLEEMPRVLGPRALRALEQIGHTLGLDYGGVDFSLGPEGEVYLFEANATMTVPRPGKGEQRDYRRGPVQRIRTAVQEMVLARTGAGLAS